jgi:hypothetical protein
LAGVRCGRRLQGLKRLAVYGNCADGVTGILDRALKLRCIEMGPGPRVEIEPVLLHVNVDVLCRRSEREAAHGRLDVVRSEQSAHTVDLGRDVLRFLFLDG